MFHRRGGRTQRESNFQPNSISMLVNPMGGLAFPGNFFLLFPPAGYESASSPPRRHPHPHLWLRRSHEDRAASLPPQHFSAWPGIMQPPLPISLRLLILSGGVLFSALKETGGGKRKGTFQQYFLFFWRMWARKEGGVRTQEKCYNWRRHPSQFLSPSPPPARWWRGSNPRETGPQGGQRSSSPFPLHPSLGPKIRRFSRINIVSPSHLYQPRLR